MANFFDTSLDKIFIDQSKKNKRAILVAFIGVIIFLSIAVIFPFKDQIFNLLYPKPTSLAVGEIHIGKLTNFYRSTQLQGHFTFAPISLGLITIPEYLWNENTDIKYIKKAGFNKEIPFVDTFSINRFMGGNTQAAAKSVGSAVANRLDPNNLLPEGDKRLFDYIILTSEGKWVYRKELIKERLQPYFDAGYKPADITLDLGNIPWDLSDPHPENGFGNIMPPKYPNQWSVVVEQFAKHLREVTEAQGKDPNDFSFKIGIEYDGKGAFNGTKEQYFELYKRTYEKIRNEFPNNKFGPGEFTAAGYCPDNPKKAECLAGRVYDVHDLLTYARDNGIYPSFVPRSLHAFLSFGQPAPSANVNLAFATFDRLNDIGKTVVPEVHQFGLLYQPFENPFTDSGLSNNEDNLQLNWHFQVLMGLKERLSPQRVFHWGGITGVGNKFLLNGIGYLRVILDRYLGSEMYHLATTSTFPSDSGVEVMAVGMEGEKKAILLSTFDAIPDQATREATISVPPSMFGNGTASEWKIIRYNPNETVYAQIKRDLKNYHGDNILSPKFETTCPYCTAHPATMAKIEASGSARIMISEYWEGKPDPQGHEGYKKIIQKSLKFRNLEATDAAFLKAESAIKLPVVANEFIVLEYNFPPKGSFGNASCTVFSGFTCDQSNYNQSLAVQFYKDGPMGQGTFIGQTIASLDWGQPVADQCGGNPNHGFGFNTPVSLKDGQPHQIYTYAINIPSGPNQLLTGSPKTITCAGPTTTPTQAPTLTPTPPVATNTPVPDEGGDPDDGDNQPQQPSQPTVKEGDVNTDNKIDIFDLSALLRAWNTNNSQSDLNKNGKVDIFDLSTLLRNWGK